MPSNIVCSSRRTTAARIVAGSAVAASTSPDAPARTASRISLIWARLAGAPRDDGPESGPREERLTWPWASARQEVTMSRSVIVAGSRTAIAKLAGSFATLSAQDLGGAAIRGALARAGVEPDTVDAVLMGQVLQAGQGQITARQAAVKGGVPMSVPRPPSTRSASRASRRSTWPTSWCAPARPTSWWPAAWSR